MSNPINNEILTIVASVIVFALLVLGTLNGLPVESIYWVGLGLFALYYAVHVGISQLAYWEYQKGNYAKTISICEAQAKRFSNDPYPHTLAACAFIQLKQYDKTVESATQAIARCGDFKTLFHLRASANHHLSNFQSALDDSTEAIRLGLDNPDIHYLQAFSLECLNRFPEALQILEQETERGNNTVGILLLKAKVLDDMNQSDAALKVCEQGFEKITEDFMQFGLSIRAFIHASLNNVDKGLEDINKGLELDPDSISFLINRAYFYGKLGRLEEGHVDLDKVAMLPDFKSNPYLQSNRARLFLLEKKPEQALEYSTAAIRISERFANVLAVHGIALLRNGKNEEAKAFLDKAIELDPFEREAFWYRSELHKMVGDTRNAQRDKAIAIGFKYAPYL